MVAVVWAMPRVGCPVWVKHWTLDGEFSSSNPQWFKRTGYLVHQMTRNPEILCAKSLRTSKNQKKKTTTRQWGKNPREIASTYFFLFFTNVRNELAARVLLAHTLRLSLRNQPDGPSIESSQLGEQDTQLENNTSMVFAAIVLGICLVTNASEKLPPPSFRKTWTAFAIDTSSVQFIASQVNDSVLLFWDFPCCVCVWGEFGDVTLV